MQRLSLALTLCAPGLPVGELMKPRIPPEHPRGLAALGFGLPMLAPARSAQFECGGLPGCYAPADAGCAPAPRS